MNNYSHLQYNYNAIGSNISNSSKYYIVNSNGSTFYYYYVNNNRTQFYNNSNINSHNYYPKNCNNIKNNFANQVKLHIEAKTNKQKMYEIKYSSEEIKPYKEIKPYNLFKTPTYADITKVKNLKKTYYQYLLNIDNINNMQKLFNAGYPLDEQVFILALGNINTMEWLLKHNCPWSQLTMKKAIEYNHISSIKWLIDNNYPFS